MTKRKIKYHLDFVNDDKPFTVSNWTTKKHEDALDELVKNEKGKTPKELDKLFRFYVVLQTLREVDETVTIEQVKNIHVEDLVELFNAVYYEGKRGIVFQEGKKNPQK